MRVTVYTDREASLEPVKNGFDFAANIIQKGHKRYIAAYRNMLSDYAINAGAKIVQMHDDAGDMIAHCIGFPKDYDNSVWTIEGVATSLRGRGVGAALLNVTSRQIRQSRGGHIECTPLDGALNFYEKCGFALSKSVFGVNTAQALATDVINATQRVMEKREIVLPSES